MITNTRLRIFSYRALGKAVTQLNNIQLFELYEMENEVALDKPPFYVSNQFVHAYTSFVLRDETRNWADVLLVSDFDKNDCIWRIPIREIEKLFRSAAESYPSHVKMTFNPKIGDCDITTD